MAIKDIVNRELVNLENCDQEPIHIPGTIQQHGCLLAAHAKSLVIHYCSENVEEYLGTDYKNILGKKLSEVFEEPLDSHLQAFLTKEDKQHLFTINQEGNSLVVLGHLSNDFIILEVERASETTLNNDFIDFSKAFINYIENSVTINDLSHKVADTIKYVTGYDRVMIYRFDEHYNGEIIGESKEEHLESFLGLHYPHTDIPKQARELYIRNQLRIIVDMDYKPVPIFTDQTTAQNSSLDLSLSILRSVSPIHVEYLKNMGVAATLTVSLIHKNRLWGLIACHHYSPKYLSYDVRLSVKLLGYFITSQIDTRLLNEELEIARQVHIAADDFAYTPFPISLNSFDEIVKDPNLFKICNAKGVCMKVREKIYKAGIVPANSVVNELTAEIRKLNKNKEHFSTNNASQAFPNIDLKTYNIFGINYFGFGETQDNFIIWFRDETISEINWGGDPTKAIEKNKNGLSPRKSFALWKETVREHSKSWLPTELKATEKIAKHLEKHIYTVFLKEEENIQRTLVDALKQANEELENINWISTHDLQEPLRKIRMMSSILLDDKKSDLSENSRNRIIKIDEATERLRNFIDSISKYSKLNHEENIFEKIDLQSFISEIRESLIEDLQTENASLLWEKLPTINGNDFLLRQLFTNLIYNSLKFASSERNPMISLTRIIDKKLLSDELKRYWQNYFIIEYADNGIGFNNEYRESIFLPFKRLHNKDSFRGSGIGLALCRRIMTKHKGFILAEGKENVGAKFYLIFPK